MKEKTNKATLTTSERTGGHNNKPLNQFEITTVTLLAVEWLQEQYNQCPKYEERIYEQDWEKAKETQKLTMINALVEFSKAHFDIHTEEAISYITDKAEQYYKQTFKTK